MSRQPQTPEELPVRTMFGPGAVGPSWGPTHGGLHFKGERKFHEVQNDSNWRAALKGELRARENFIRLHPEMDDRGSSRGSSQHVSTPAAASTPKVMSPKMMSTGLLANSPRAINDPSMRAYLTKMRNRVLAIKSTGGSATHTYPQPAKAAKCPTPAPPPPAIIAGNLQHSKHGWTSAPRSGRQGGPSPHHHPLKSHWTHRLSQPKHTLGETAYLRGDKGRWPEMMGSVHEDHDTHFVTFGHTGRGYLVPIKRST